ncbi:UTRA domain-containing protein [Streptomyces sp. P38-E01]|uniref:UTRA domain-containing protein n=1 Tax=Streptomyces tardus TaxID=2780544 RepID=A0A949JCY4_9ACTN|nr:UTRA domain-containing protein [Streptomyces tardus]MBU7597581.1 UTRA domain-containing protein [Streptomyces tardus]
MSGQDWVSSSTLYVGPGGGDVWAAEAGSRGGRGTQHIVRAGEVTAPDAVASMLAVEPGASVVVRRRLMYLDEVPCELTDSHYPLAIAAGTPLSEPAKIRGGANALLAKLGHVGARVREDVCASAADAAEREALALPGDAVVLRLARTTYDGDGRAVQADLITMPAEGRRLRHELETR